MLRIEEDYVVLWEDDLCSVTERQGLCSATKRQGLGSATDRQG